MFVEFTVENHLSFRDPSRFVMSASPVREYEERNVFEARYDGLRLLKSAVLFGDNASGKSNWINSLAFMRDLVIQSPLAQGREGEVHGNPFRLEVGRESALSRFEIQIVLKEQLMRYGFALQGKKIHSEWLFATNKRKESELFIRAGNEFRFSPLFKKECPIAETIKSLIEPSKLFLSIIGQFRVPMVHDIIRWFSEIKFFLGHVSYIDINRIGRILHGSNIESFVRRLFKDLDLGFVRLKPELMKLYQAAGQAGNEMLANRRFIDLFDVNDEYYIIKAIHDVFKDGVKVDEVEFDLMRDESTGSQKIVAIAGPIVDTLVNGGLIVMDELDASLHPGLIKSILGWFNSTISNPSNAQLIAALHNPSVLDHRNRILRRDQQFFFEKDKFGVSRFSTTYDKGFRNDASFQNEYLDGKIVKGPPINTQLSLF